MSRAPWTTLSPTTLNPALKCATKGSIALPVSRLFEKRFCRSPEQDTHFWGYNQQPLMWLTGPGFFVVNEPKEEPLFIDYRSVPAEKLNTWPEIHPNEKGVSKLVYAGMQDYMRKVSSRVTVGEACKKENPWGSILRSFAWKRETTKRRCPKCSPQQNRVAARNQAPPPRAIVAHESRACDPLFFAPEAERAVLC